MRFDLRSALARNGSRQWLIAGAATLGLLWTITTAENKSSSPLPTSPQAVHTVTDGKSPDSQPAEPNSSATAEKLSSIRAKHFAEGSLESKETGKSTSPESEEPLGKKGLRALGLTLALLTILLVVLRKAKVALPGSTLPNQLAIEGSLKLNSKTTLYVVNHGGKQLLIASGSEQISLLANETAKNEDQLHSSRLIRKRLNRSSSSVASSQTSKVTVENLS